MKDKFFKWFVVIGLGVIAAVCAIVPAAKAIKDRVKDNDKTSTNSSAYVQTIELN